MLDRPQTSYQYIKTGMIFKIASETVKFARKDVAASILKTLFSIFYSRLKITKFPSKEGYENETQSIVY